MILVYAKIFKASVFLILLQGYKSLVKGARKLQSDRFLVIIKNKLLAESTVFCGFDYCLSISPDPVIRPVSSTITELKVIRPVSLCCTDFLKQGI
jgi:hypothetical protein